MKSSLSVEELNELANNLYFEGRTSDAIKMFNSALEHLEDKSIQWSETPMKVRDGSLSTCENIHCEFHARSLEPQYAPDSYLEGECDVGPRAVFCFFTSTTALQVLQICRYRKSSYYTTRELFTTWTAITKTQLIPTA
jgi:hypothetical protein